MDAAIRIRMDNAAFDPDPGPELARILRWLADDIERDTLQEYCALRDTNGNRVGELRVTGLPEAD